MHQPTLNWIGVRQNVSGAASAGIVRELRCVRWEMTPQATENSES